MAIKQNDLRRVSRKEVLILVRLEQIVDLLVDLRKFVKHEGVIDFQIQAAMFNKKGQFEY